MSMHPGRLTGVAVPTRRELEALIRPDYERLHPGDTFEDFRRRSKLDKNEKGLMKSWLAVAARRHAESSDRREP